MKLLESKGHELMIRNTPADPVEKLSKLDCPQADQLELSDVRELRKLYQMVVGSLIWANTTVRFDINAALCLLCRFMSNPGEKHAEAMIWTVGYFKGTVMRGIEYSVNGNDKLVGYVDSDHASCEDRRSMYCYMFMLANGPITCKSGFTDRRCISGTAESEVRAVHASKEACMHLKYLIKVFDELGLPSIVQDVEINDSQPNLAIYEDNSACISWSEQETGSTKMKHFETDLYWIQDEAQQYKSFKLVKIDTKKQLADPGTKNLSYREFVDKVFQFMTDFVEHVVDYFSWGK